MPQRSRKEENKDLHLTARQKRQSTTILCRLLQRARKTIAAPIPQFLEKSYPFIRDMTFSIWGFCSEVWILGNFESCTSFAGKYLKPYLVLIMYNIKERLEEEERDGGSCSSYLSLKDATQHLPSSTTNPPRAAPSMALRVVGQQNPLPAEFIIQCTDSQAPQKRRAPRCCCLATEAQCLPRCPVRGCWSGCQCHCCCVFEFHWLYCIQGWIRQPEKT